MSDAAERLSRSYTAVIPGRDPDRDPVRDIDAYITGL